MLKKLKQQRARCYQRLRRNKTLRQIKLEWDALELTSKLILVIGVILLAELIIAIFFYPDNDAPFTDLSLNVVFRTGLASVMGYIFGGMNQAEISHTTSNNQTQTPRISLEKDYTSSANPDESKDCDCEQDKELLKNATSIRAFAAMMVCLVSIITLYTASYFNRVEYREGLIQMRDLISTTIGFLISRSNHKS